MKTKPRHPYVATAVHARRNADGTFGILIDTADEIDLMIKLSPEQVEALQTQLADWT